MNKLVGDLLDVVSIEAGHLAIAPAPGDARELVQQTLEAFGPAASAKGIALTAEVSDNEVFAAFDHDRIFQVLANVVSNALKFTPEGGRIQVRAETDRGVLHFSVTDTGAGVAPEVLGRMFERFWRGSGSDRSGFGLGLFIARSLVEAHGGRIWAESDGASGTTIHFTIPELSGELRDSGES